MKYRLFDSIFLYEEGTWAVERLRLELRVQCYLFVKQLLSVCRQNVGRVGWCSVIRLHLYSGEIFRSRTVCLQPRQNYRNFSVVLVAYHFCGIGHNLSQITVYLALHVAALLLECG